MLFEGLGLDGLHLGKATALAAERIIRRYKEFDFSVPWSLCELRPDHNDYAWAQEWAMRSAAAAVAPFPSPCPELGLVFLLFACERARREADQDNLWAVVLRGLATGWMILPQPYPAPIVRRSMDLASRHYGLRHSLDVEASHKYRNTICMHFGLTRHGLLKHLPTWLANAPVSTGNLDHALVTLDALLGDTSANRSESFVFMWDTLQQYRAGGIDSATADNRLTVSPWLLDDWVEEVISAAGAGRRTSQRGPTARRLLSEPLLRIERNRPVFEVRLTHLGDINLDKSSYLVMQDDTPLKQLDRRSDLSYADTTLHLAPNASTSLITINDIDDSRQCAYSEEVQLWPGSSDAVCFVEGKQTARCPKGRCHLLVRSGLDVRPRPASTWAVSSDWRLCAIEDAVQTSVLDESGEHCWPQPDDLVANNSLMADLGLCALRCQPDEATWGDSVQADLMLGPGMEVVACRTADGPVEWQMNGRAVSIGPIPLHPWRTEGDLKVRLTVRRGEERVVVWRGLAAPGQLMLVGGSQRRSDGWHPGGAGTVLAEADKSLPWRLASKYTATGDDERSWEVWEGPALLGAPARRTGPLPGASAGARWLGEPVRAMRDLPLPEPECDVIAGSLVRRGMVEVACADTAGRFLRLDLTMPCTPVYDDMTQYKVVVWRNDGTVRDYFGDEITPHERSWLVDLGEPGPPVFGVCICRAIDGATGDFVLGSWFTDEWPDTLLDDDLATPQEAFALLRWMWAPVLRAGMAKGVLDLARRRPDAMLAAWLNLPDLPLGLGWPDQQPADKARWPAAARSVLLRLWQAGWHPVGRQCGEILESVSRDEHPTDVWSAASDRLVSVSPNLFAHLFRWWTSHDQQARDDPSNVRLLKGWLHQRLMPDARGERGLLEDIENECKVHFAPEFTDKLCELCISTTMPTNRVPVAVLYEVPKFRYLVASRLLSIP